MKIKLHIFLLFFASTLLAQNSSWSYRSRIASPLRPHSIYFIDSLMGFALGSVDFDSNFRKDTQLRLYRTLDGGKSWKLASFNGFIDTLHGSKRIIATPKTQNSIFCMSQTNDVYELGMMSPLANKWSYVANLPPLPTSFHNHFTMFNDNEGIILSFGTIDSISRIFKTKDGWKTYEETGDSLFHSYFSTESRFNGNNPEASPAWSGSYTGYVPVVDTVLRGFNYLSTYNRGSNWRFNHIDISELDTFIFDANAHFVERGISTSMWFLPSKPYKFRIPYLNPADPILSVGFIYSTNLGFNFGVNSTFAGRTRAFTPISDSAVWMSVTRRKEERVTGNVDDNVYASVFAFTPNNGKTWELDSTSARNELDEFDIVDIKFPAPGVGYALGYYQNDAYLFKYYNPKASVDKAEYQNNHGVSLRFLPNEHILSLNFGDEKIQLKSINVYDVTGNRIPIETEIVTNTHAVVSSMNLHGWLLIVCSHNYGVTTQKIFIE